jgi:DNA-binding GntR family transcriptional regulator
VEGLVEILPQRGTRAARIRLPEIVEAMLIRRALEGMVAETAALRLPPRVLEELEANIEEQKAAVARRDRPASTGSISPSTSAWSRAWAWPGSRR